MSKKNAKGGHIITIIAIVVILIVIIVGVILLNKNKPTEESSVKINLNEEVWLNVNESAKLKNSNDQISLKIDSDLNYTEGAEYEVPYSLVVNDVEYTGTYTFATGYSIHSEPNNIPYKIEFVGIKQGSIGIKVIENK